LYNKSITNISLFETFMFKTKSTDIEQRKVYMCAWHLLAIMNTTAEGNYNNYKINKNVLLTNCTMNVCQNKRTCPYLVLNKRHWGSTLVVHPKSTKPRETTSIHSSCIYSVTHILEKSTLRE